MDVTWKNRAIIAVAAIVSIVFGFGVASGDALLGILTLIVLAAVSISWLSGGLLAPLILGGTLIGYIVGNRGFAQISLVSSAPLLPAEVALGSCLLLVMIQGATQRRWPIGRDFFSYSLLLWMALSSIRLFWDVRTFGAVALRDFATIYYALFFFIAYFLAEDERPRRLLLRAIGVGVVLLPWVFFASRLAPDFFLGLTLRGVPVVYYKSDLASAFAAVGLLWAYARGYTAAGAARWMWRVTAVLNFAVIGYTSGRATMLGLMVATVILLLAGERRFFVQLVAAAVLLATLSLSLSVFEGEEFTQSKVYSFYEHALSITDVNAQRNYEAALDSADNNRFRLVWWQLVARETAERDPLLGQGWGYDLGEPFARAYFGTRPDDFTVRSPHNIFLTVFGRTGLVGLIAFSAVVIAFLRRVARVARAHQGRTERLETLCLWVAAVVIFVTSCLGVVLEGPMGAVLFWTLLGIGCADLARGADEPRESAEEQAIVGNQRSPVGALKSSVSGGRSEMTRQ